MFWGISSLLSTISFLYIYREKRSVNCHSLTRYSIFNITFFLWFILIGTIAFLMVPNNWDSMTYHLARVVNWIQNGSVSYYPTNINRQLYLPILAEYTILHTYLLIGSDILANMIQFAAYTLSTVLIYMIAAKLNLHKSIKYLMALLFMTIPMAIAQSMTTQTDLVGCLWLLAFIYVAIDFVQQKELRFNRDSFYLVFEGATICALAFLSKGSVCPGICVFLLWIVSQYINKKAKVLPLCIFGFMACLIVCSLVFPTFYRNYHYAGDIFASNYMGRISIGNWHPKYMLLNSAKNYALLAASSFSYEILSSMVMNLSALLSLDINHLDISWTTHFVDEISSVAFSFHHDTVPCPLVSITWLICCVIFSYIIFQAKKNIKDKLFVLVCICAVFIGLIAVRYQTWGNRLLLPYCAVMIIIIGWMMNLLSKQKKIFLFTIFFLSFFAVSDALRTLAFQMNYFIPENRNRRYFVNYPALYPVYISLTDYIKSCEEANNIGILLGEDTWEYPLWKMLSDKRIIQVVPGKTEGEMPDYILAINRDMDASGSFIYLGTTFKPVYFYEDNKNFIILAPEKSQHIKTKKENKNENI